MPEHLNEPYQQLTAAVERAAARTRTRADVEALVARLDRISVDLAKMAEHIRAERERVGPGDCRLLSELASNARDTAAAQD
jgi:hypothetical protein